MKRMRNVYKCLTNQYICATALVAVSLSLFSCAKEELDFSKLNLVGDPKPITVNAVLPQSAGTDKTTLSTDGKVCWESDDKITVNGTELGISAVLSDTLALFEGEVGPIATTSGNGYWATYPTSLDATGYTAGSVVVTLPATQTYSGNEIPNYMVAFNTADGGNLSLPFRNMCSIIKIPVKAADGKTGDAAKLSRIEIESTQTVSGTAMVNWNGGSPEFGSWTNGSTIMTLNCGNADVSTEKTFCIMLPAGTHSLTVRFFDATDDFMQKTVSGILARNFIYTLPVVSLNTIGDFSVSPTLKVKFSPGNLQYQASSNTWRFAAYQWECIGNAPGNTTGSNRNTQVNWIDLFCWGTSGWNSGANAYQPWATSVNSIDYYPGGGYDNDLTRTNADWGMCNDIYNPLTGSTDPRGTWRTLTKDEWDYLLLTYGTCRATAHPDWWIFNRVIIDDADGAKDVKCLVIYPDGVTSDLTGGKLTKNNSKDAVHITADDFKKLDAARCAFMTATGYRHGTEVNQVDYDGYYWSSTHGDWDNNTLDYRAYCFHFDNGGYVNPHSHDQRHDGRAVRLVKDIKK